MSNLKHYIKGISSGDAFFSLQKKFRFISMLCGIYQFAMTVLFYFAHVYILMLFSFCCGLFFVILINNLIKRERFVSAMVLSVCIVTIISFMSTLCIGFETGFSAFCFACISAVFYLSFVIDSLQKKEGIPIIFSLFLLASYIFDYIAMLFVKPFYTLPAPGWVNLFHICNYSLSFLIVIIFNVLFAWEIKSRNHLLSARNEQLDELAHKDPLTHLYNRRSMSAHLQNSIEQLKITGKRFSLILGDIDDFKHVNDTYGHDAGDLILVSVAKIITENIKEGDVVCRWGGEEILILINAPIETAMATAEKIRTHIESHVSTFEGQSIRVTMTFGLSESIPGYKIEQLIQQADDKLYDGKKNGKNQVVV